MIVVLALVYVALLQVLVWLKVLRWNLGTIISIPCWILFLFIALFIPLQFSAPAGKVVVYRYTVAIVPRVTGEVVEVHAQANTPLQKDDVLFRIDPVPFQAAVDGLQSQLDLAQLRLGQAKRLADSDAGSRFEVQSYEAQVKQLSASLRNAQYNLNATTVRAPSQGFVTGVGLRVGSRVASLPMSPAMTFVDTSRSKVVIQVPEIFVRHIEIGQPAEIAFKVLPGVIATGTVTSYVPANSAGQFLPGGNLITPQPIQTGAFFAVVELSNMEIETFLPTGATGDAAIYTDVGGMTHIIRKIMIRMTAWTNFVNPL